MKWLALSIAALTATTACGTRGDATTGVDLVVTQITVDSTDINTTCDGGDVGRLFQKTSAEVGLEAKSSGQEGVDVELDSYILEYIPLDGGPELTAHDYPFQISLLIPGNGSLNFGVELVPISTKKQYYNATTGSTAFNKISLYQAHYTFTGTTEFEDEISTEGDITFALGNNYVVNCE